MIAGAIAVLLAFARVFGRYCLVACEACFVDSIFWQTYFFLSFFFKPHNCSLGFYMSEIYASWKMTYLGVEPAKLVPESHAPTTRPTPCANLARSRVKPKTLNLVSAVTLAKRSAIKCSAEDEMNRE